jgi:hypothetical protein
MLRDGGYDVRTWNCSNVCKLLILSGMDPRHHEDMEQAMVCSPADLLSIAGPDDLFSKLRYLSTSPFIDCRPDDVRRAAQAYNGVCMAQPKPFATRHGERADAGCAAIAELPSARQQFSGGEGMMD